MLALLDRPRLPFLALAAVVFALLGFGLYLQHYKGLSPCPMCIMQRYAFLLVGVVALLAGTHGSTGPGRRVWGALIGLIALAGAGVAARQSWIQRYPPEIPECGPGLEYLVDSFPLTELLPMIFQGEGECTAVDWSLLGLSIANWSLVALLCTLIFALCIMLRRPARR
jgi:disulfide bond formation protein DsbB